ncbi:MAG: hypothetical protein LQ338_005055 [Usnochroma carphineum]|nr:MAG: hypothetical protein LQ338_005055 [Usnochroma carphineum]
MADLTPTLNDLLQRHNAHLTRRKGNRPPLKDEFLKEAYTINSHISSLKTYLLSVRHAYLRIDPPPRFHQQHHQHQKRNPEETTPAYFTNPQRDQLDAESKSLLRSLHASIRQLEEAETLRQETARKLQQHKHSRRYGFSGALGRWAAGDSDGGGPEEQWEKSGRDTLTTWRESVIWYLRKKLEEAGEVQRGMMEKRLQREVERSKSVLYKSRGAKGVDVGLDDFTVGDGGGKGMNGYVGQKGVALEEEEREKGEQGLSEEQAQLLKEENEGMLRHYEDTLDQVRYVFACGSVTLFTTLVIAMLANRLVNIRTAEKSMIEVSELQNTLVANLETQSSNIEQLVGDSLNTTENIGSGNKELKRATERKSTARMVFFASCGLCAFLITWDLVF